MFRPGMPAIVTILALTCSSPTATAADDETITNSIGLKLERIPAGSFLMGADPGDDRGARDYQPPHKVTIGRPFYLGVYEVTQREYKQVVGTNPSQFKESDQHPVERVSWFDAVAFCNKLSEREGKKPYYRIEGDKVAPLGTSGYRLPTEAEWEYAARAGTTTKFPFGDFDDSTALALHAWFSVGSPAGEKTHAVGQKLPNRFGLHDMCGNVWEWCGDWYDENYYKQSPATDPVGPAQGIYRVSRGGGWFDSSSRCGLMERWRGSALSRQGGIGFRVALGL